VIQGNQVAIFDAAGRAHQPRGQDHHASAALVDKAAIVTHGQGNPRTAGSDRPYAGTFISIPLAVRCGISAWGCAAALSRATRLTISACGTPITRAMVGKYWFREAGGAAGGDPTWSVGTALSRSPVYPKDGAALFVSPIGRDADTLAALREAKAKGQSPSRW